MSTLVSSEAPPVETARLLDGIQSPADVKKLLSCGYAQEGVELRIVGDDGQNLRHNVDVGGTTLVDTPLNYTPGVAATGITAAAYTNNDLDSNTATSLSDIDTTLDQVVLQSPPNSGTLAATGKTAVDATGDAGFDIYSFVVNGRTRSNLGFAVASSGNVSRFYSVNLLTGRLTLIGRFATDVIDIAVPLAQ